MPYVLYDTQTSTYEMWYDGSYGDPHWYPYWIGYATSSDGIVWEKLDTAVFKPTPGTWDESTVECQWIIKENGLYKMWYTGRSAIHPSYAIGYATSPDGIHWTKDTLNNPVLEAGPVNWEADGCLYCSVIYDEMQYRMWYNGLDAVTGKASIGHATSVDGVHWQKDSLNNPILCPGSSGEWDGRHVASPIVLKIDEIYHMWYTGFRDSPVSTSRRVGYAWSSDGIHWTKYDDPTTINAPYAESDPVIVPSPSGQWDDGFLEASNVVLIGDSLHMWYGGNRLPTSTYPWLIGRAASFYVPPTGLKFTSDIQPEKFTLYQNYPNPFNPTTVISLQLAVSSQVKLEIFNLTGQKITTLLSASLPRGSHSVEWDASEVASGVYLYRLEANDHVESRKMILMK